MNTSYEAAVTQIKVAVALSFRVAAAIVLQNFVTTYFVTTYCVTTSGEPELIPQLEEQGFLMRFFIELAIEGLNSCVGILIIT